MGEVVEKQIGAGVLPPVARLAALRVRTVARLLGIRRDDVYRLCKARVFRGSYIEGERGWRIPAADVERYQQERSRMTDALVKAVRM